MVLFLTGILIFFAAHFFTASARQARASLVGKLGEGPYKGLYSLVALAGFALIVWGWRSADITPLYNPPSFFRHITYALMLPALILIAAAYAPAGKIAAAVKHPMLAAVKVWAFAHLLSNGDVRSVILFGAFLLFAVVDRVLVKKRGEPTRSAGPVVNDIIAVAAGIIAYAAIFFYLHRFIAGVALS